MMNALERDARAPRRWLSGWLLALALILVGGMGEFAGRAAAPIGEFEAESDVGVTPRRGSAEFDTARGEYRITGGGANMWESTDAFHFVWRRMSGDVSLFANVQLLGQGKQEHRKAGWVIRQSLDADSPYVSAVVHGDGLTSMQYRQEKGGTTREVRSPVSGPLGLGLERRGDIFTFRAARNGALGRAELPINVTMHDPVYVGLAVCSHDVQELETAVFWDVRIEGPSLPPHKLAITSILETISPDGTNRRTVLRLREHFEAPNWSRDGKFLIFNRLGRLYTVPVEGGVPAFLDTGSATHCNNDHGLSPDGKLLALSNSPGDRSLIYVMPSAGGEPRLITPLGPSYWHGWSPDGKTLAYCAERGDNFDIYTIPVEGGEEKRLTDAAGLDDGPEYSPDGKWIYFNSERTGLMQIWRMHADGSGQEQVTDHGHADWFAHPSPDGKWLVFLSYDKSVKGHPPNKDVMLRIMPLEGGPIRVLAKLFGGQGTINVPSWSPDSRRLAFVSYRLLGQKQ